MHVHPAQSQGTSLTTMPEVCCLVSGLFSGGQYAKSEEDGTESWSDPLGEEEIRIVMCLKDWLHP